MITQFLLALSFLTRLPMPKGFDASGLTLAQAAWAFPCAGLIVGALSGSVYSAALTLHLTPPIAAWLALASAILLTGGLHEDGLADMADGLSHGREREQKLAILRDSHIGSYGVLALVVILAIRACAMSVLPGGLPALGLFMAIGAASRAVMATLMYVLPRARVEGLAADAGRPGHGQTLAALLIAALALAVFTPLRAALAGLAALILANLIVGRLAQKHFGGITGDVLGAAQQLSETALWVTMAGLYSAP